MDKRHSSLVTYDAPPVVEVAMSVQFDPPKGLTQAHLGAFWHSQRDVFPRVGALQPISTTTENFEAPGQWLPPSLQLALTSEPNCRLQMTSNDDEWMCQVQRERLVVNWRKRTEVYPRFGSTLSRFKNAWQTWHTFLHGSELTAPRPRMWEVTYVNRIPCGELWKTPSDWPVVLPGLWGGPFVAADGLALQGFQGQWVWGMRSPPARLYVEPKPARSQGQPSQELLMLTLTARGVVIPAEPTDTTDSFTSIESGLAFGRKLIVITFDKIASADAKKAWGRHADTK